jgi:hypothetical protein
MRQVAVSISDGECTPKRQKSQRSINMLANRRLRQRGGIAIMPFARLLDCSKEQYHADPTEVPSLSYSVAKILLTESPMHAYYYHPRLGGHVREQTKAMGKGQVIHKLLLGIGADIVVVRADNFRTKAAQELRDAAIAAGKTRRLSRMNTMELSRQRKPFASGWLSMILI